MPPEPNPPTPPNPPAPTPEDIAKENAALKAELEKLRAKPPTPPPPADDPDLKEKARREQEERDNKARDHRSLESSIRFNMSTKEFLKLNSSLLPKDAPGIFETAEKEKYDSEIDKSRSIKSALIQSFFAVQANVDELTPAQKQKLDEYLKLTKNEKHNRAEEFYDNVLEPSLESARKIRKADQLRNGHVDSSDDALKEKMRKNGLRHYNVKERNQNA